MILCLRVAALYNRNKLVLRCLWTSFGITATLSTTFTVFTIVALHSAFSSAQLHSNCLINSGIEELVYNQLTGVCLPNDISYKTYGIFVIPMVFDVVIIGLTTFKAYRHVRRESGALVVCIVLYYLISFWMMILVFKALHLVP